MSLAAEREAVSLRIVQQGKGRGMWRYLAYGAAAALMIAAGWILFNGRARTESTLPAQPRSLVGQQDEAGGGLPDSVPEATPKTREEKRFGRYDKDRDGAITREEYLASRRKAYAKLDTNGDGRLSFEEWAIKTTTKFATADRDQSGTMLAAEFATTAPKRSATPRRDCPPVRTAQATAGDDG